MTRNLIDDLNEKQKEAVLATEGPLLIVAGAGAGKTKTLTYRIVKLVSQGVAPQEILAITFTNKAAKEMRERALALLERMAPDGVGASSRSDFRSRGIPFISTFHSLGVFIIKENAELLGLTRHFTIADSEDSLKYIKEAIEKNGLNPKEFDPRRARHVISKSKGDSLSPDTYATSAQSHLDKQIAMVWKTYEELLYRDKALDFDDLLLKTVQILKTHPDVKKRYQGMWRYVHIDEYQDTNELQYELSKLLVGPERNLCVVGDSDQNIYSWRGANLKNILHFEKDYPNAKVVLLDQNYRSTKTILSAANTIIQKNSVRVDKNLFTENGDGEEIELVETYDETAEGEYISLTVDELLRAGANPKDIAVLYRANFQSRALEEAFLKAEIPYQVLGTKFFERREIKDVLSYVKAALNKENLGDIKRIINVPARGIGKVTLAKLFAGQMSDLPGAMQKKISIFYEKLDRMREVIDTKLPSEIIKFVITESGIEDAMKKGSSDDTDRLENMYELVTVALSYDDYGIKEGIEKMLENAALASDQDALSEEKDGVKLMTVHAAKGLEFDSVFITGMEQDLFPHRKDYNASKEDQEEERRLFYVAITRARKKLFITYTGMRTLYGQRQINAPSEFIADLPEELLKRSVHYGKGGAMKTIYFD